MQQTRIGFQSVETWVLSLAATFGPMIPGFPDHPATLAPIVVWGLARLGQKILGPASPGERSWQTVEFWVGLAGTLIAAAQQYFAPQTEIITVVIFVGLTIGMAAVRIFRHVEVGQPKSV